MTDSSEPDQTPSRPLTDTGRQTLDRLVRCGRDRLTELSIGWQPEQHQELRNLINDLAAEFLETAPTGSTA